jgi:hypothetical protein
MRFGVALPNSGPLAAPETRVRLARLVEELGVDSIRVSDRSSRLPPRRRAC